MALLSQGTEHFNPNGIQLGALNAPPLVYQVWHRAQQRAAFAELPGQAALLQVGGNTPTLDHFIYPFPPAIVADDLSIWANQNFGRRLTAQGRDSLGSYNMRLPGNVCPSLFYHLTQLDSGWLQLQLLALNPGVDWYNCLMLSKRYLDVYLITSHGAITGDRFKIEEVASSCVQQAIDCLCTFHGLQDWGDAFGIRYLGKWLYYTIKINTHALWK